MDRSNAGRRADAETFIQKVRMSKNTFFKRQTSDQPGWAKGVQNTIIVGGIALVAYIIYKNNKDKKDLADANTAKTAADRELLELAKEGIFPTLYDTEFETLAQILVQAMGGCGTDEDSIYSVFRQMKNDADVLKLISVFGIGFYQPCVWSSPVSYSIWLANDKAFGGGLPTWLGYDLGSSEIAKVNGILRDKGIQFQF